MFPNPSPRSQMSPRSAVGESATTAIKIIHKTFMKRSLNGLLGSIRRVGAKVVGSAFSGFSQVLESEPEQ